MNKPERWPGRIFRSDTCTTTQQLAREAIARQDWLDHDVFVTNEMTDGRGAGGAWHAPAGGLWASIISQSPPEPVAFWPAIAAAEAIAQLTSLHPTLKWPNDLLLGSKKVGGILIERLADPKLTIIGIGINVSITSFPENIQNTATSIALQHPAPPAIADLLDQLLDALIKIQHAELTNEFASRCPMLGQPARITERGVSTIATPRSINPDGSLALTQPDGTSRTLHAAAHTDIRPINISEPNDCP